MVKYLLVMAVLVTASCQDNHNHDTTNRQIYKILEDEFKERLLSVLNKKLTSCRIKTTSFEEAITNTTDCFKSLHEDNETMCDAVLKNYYLCVEPIAKAFDDCLPKDLENLGSHLINSTAYVVEYLCSLTIDQIQALTNQCIKEIDFMISNSKCFIRAETKLSTQFRDGLATTFQDVICSVYPDVKPCFEIKVKTACANPNTREIVIGMLDSLLDKPCNRPAEPYEAANHTEEIKEQNL